MRISKWFLITGAGLSFALGVVVGWRVLPSPSSEPGPGPGPEGAVGGRSTNLRESGRGPAPVPPGPAWRSRSSRADRENPEGLVISPSLLTGMSEASGKRSLKHDLFSEDDVIAAYLDINPEERSELEEAWEGIKEEVRSLEANKCVAEIPGDGPATLTVPDLSAHLPGLTASLQDELEGVLGKNRAALFASAKQLHPVLERAMGQRTYQLSFEPIPGERWRYRITSEAGGMKKTWVTEDLIPAEIRHLTDAAGIAAQANGE